MLVKSQSQSQYLTWKVVYSSCGLALSVPGRQSILQRQTVQTLEELHVRGVQVVDVYGETVVVQQYRWGKTAGGWLAVPL